MQTVGPHLEVEVLAGVDRGLTLVFAVPGSYILGRAGTPDLHLQRMGDPSLEDSHLILTADEDGTLKVNNLGPAGSAMLGNHPIRREGGEDGVDVVASGAILRVADTAIRVTLAHEGVVVGRVKQAHLSHYHILEEIGQGAFSRVYHAVERATGRQVAVKRLRIADNPQKDKLISAFLREIQTTSVLDHPCIAKVYAAGRRGNDPFLVMDFVEGPDLATCVEMRGALSSDLVRRIARGVLQALHHAHEHGVIHRDLKPSNVMLRGECEHAAVVLVDFGLAIEEAKASSWGLTMTGDFRGTPAFTAPECIADARRHSVRSDVFSVGATLYYALTARTCREAPQEHDTSLEALTKAEVVPLQVACPDAAPDVMEAVERALALDPAKRWGSAKEMLEALDS